MKTKHSKTLPPANQMGQLIAQCKSIVEYLRKNDVAQRNLATSNEAHHRNLSALLTCLSRMAGVSSFIDAKIPPRLIMDGGVEGNLFKIVVDGSPKRLQPKLYDVLATLSYAKKYRRISHVPRERFGNPTKGSFSVNMWRVREATGLKILCHDDGYEINLEPEEIGFLWAGNRFTEKDIVEHLGPES
ncbi:MAG: hypothetical protein V1809_08845 [Planctomycetota bacterium]